MGWHQKLKCTGVASYQGATPQPRTLFITCLLHTDMDRISIHVMKRRTAQHACITETPRVIVWFRPMPVLPAHSLVAAAAGEDTVSMERGERRTMRLQELDFIYCIYRSARVWADGRYCTLYAMQCKPLCLDYCSPTNPQIFPLPQGCVRYGRE